MPKNLWNYIFLVLLLILGYALTSVSYYSAYYGLTPIFGIIFIGIIIAALLLPLFFDKYIDIFNNILSPLLIHPFLCPISAITGVIIYFWVNGYLMVWSPGALIPIHGFTIYDYLYYSLLYPDFYIYCAKVYFMGFLMGLIPFFYRKQFLLDEDIKETEDDAQEFYVQGYNDYINFSEFSPPEDPIHNRKYRKGWIAAKIDYDLIIPRHKLE